MIFQLGETNKEKIIYLKKEEENNEKVMRKKREKIRVRKRRDKVES